MPILEAVIATTHLDTQGERLAPDAIRHLAESVNSRFIPVGIEHDPRIPPQGRLRSCFVREREDGELEAVAEMEIFDEHSVALDQTREIALHSRIGDRLIISCDWTHRGPVDQADIKASAEALGTNPTYDAKKSADPISVISLTGAFALGGIASGLFNKIGSDLWDTLRPRLAKLTSRTESRKGEQLLIFRVQIEVDGKAREIETILSDPTPEQIETFFRRSAQVLDQVLPVYVHNAPDVRQFVFEYSNGELELKFGVRSDCQPLFPTLSVKAIVEQTNKGSGSFFHAEPAQGPKRTP